MMADDVMPASNILPMNEDLAKSTSGNEAVVVSSIDALDADASDMRSIKAVTDPEIHNSNNINLQDRLFTKQNDSNEPIADDKAESVGVESTSETSVPHAGQQEQGAHSVEQYSGHGNHPYYQDPVLALHYQSQGGYSSQMQNPPGTKAKRKRASPHQLALLNQIYEYTFFPSTELRNAIGKELGMAPRTVQIWFQNRRQSWRSQKVRDGAEDSPRSNDNERGGWEVLRSFQARRANGEILEYDYMSIPSPQSAGAGQHGRSDLGGLPFVPYHPGMMQVALSSNDQFNSSMQQVPMLLPHTPRHVPQRTIVPTPAQSNLSKDETDPKDAVAEDLATKAGDS